MPDRELAFLGTASQAPTRLRNHNGYFLRLLVLTHFSQRYESASGAGGDERLAGEAAEVFGGEVVVARDLTRVPVPPRRAAGER